MKVCFAAQVSLFLTQSNVADLEDFPSDFEQQANSGAKKGVYW